MSDGTGIAAGGSPRGPGRAPHAPRRHRRLGLALLVGLTCAAPLTFGWRSAPARGEGAVTGATGASGASGASGAIVATAAPAPPEELKRARNRVRGRQEWRQLRRMTGGRSADRPEGCNACRPERDKDDKEPPVRQRSPAGCGALSQAFSGLSLVLVGLVIAALVGLLIWAIVKYSGDKDDDGKDADFGDETGLALSPRTPPGERPASVYLKRALSLAEAGDFRGALRQLLLGAMSWTERKNLIRFRQGLTNRDYLRALRRRPTQRQGLQAVVVEFEKVYFGRRPATAARFERVLPGYRHGFEGGDDRLDESDDRDRDDRDGTDDQVRSGGGGAGRPGEQGGGAAAAPAAPGT